MIITKWFRIIKNDAGELVVDFNHIENGFDPSKTHPTPNTPDQNSWLKAKWMKQRAHLVDGKVVYIHAFGFGEKT